MYLTDPDSISAISADIPHAIWKGARYDSDMNCGAYNAWPIGLIMTVI